MAKKDDLLSFPVRLAEELERMFEEIIHRPWGLPRELGPWNPSVDLYETAEAFVLEADLPGVKGEDVKVEVHNDDLVLQGRRTLEQSHSDGKFHTMERCSGEFLRRMRLPESIDKETIQAKFKDGVLRVILPKMKKRGAQT
jgi:HSP20 family protein